MIIFEWWMYPIMALMLLYGIIAIYLGLRLGNTLAEARKLELESIQLEGWMKREGNRIQRENTEAKV